jgi:CBS domain-containing protein
MLADTLTMDEVLIQFALYHISGAPVVRAETKAFIGWCASFDAVHALMSEIEQINPVPKDLIRETQSLAGAPHVHSAWGVLRKLVRSVTSSDRLLGHDIDQRECELDNMRRAYMESISADDIQHALMATLTKTLGEVRKSTHSEEDGRMVSRITCEDSDLLELVRGGMLRNVVVGGDELMPRHTKTCHRVCTYDIEIDDSDDMKEKMVVGMMVSQSDIVEFLYDHVDELTELSRFNLRDLGLGARTKHRVFPDSDVVCCLPTERLFNVFVRMHITGLSVIPVIDEPRGRLIGVVSVNDIARAVSSSNREFIDSPLIHSVASYLESQVDKPLITVHEDSDFLDALSALVRGGVHHLFVLDLEGSPVRTVTPTDILQRVALPSARKIGWRYDSYEIHPRSFDSDAVVMIA